MEVPAQHVVAGIALVLHHAQHTPHGHTHQRQRVAGQHQGPFNGLGHHFGGASVLQFVEVGVILRAHHHGHLRRVRTGVGQHLEGGGHVDVGHHHGTGAHQAGRHQGLQAGGVAIHHRVAGGSGLAHPVGVQVQRHVGNAFALQHARQVLAAAAVAADDDVLAGVDGLARNGGHLQRLLHPVAGHQLHHDAVAVHDEEGRGQHRQHHGREDRVHQRGLHQPVFLGERQQHKAKLARLRQEQPRAQRHARGGPHQPRQHQNDDRLDQQRHRQQRQHQRPAVHQNVPVQHHADGDEEQPQQHIVEGANVRAHLVAVFGF